MRLIPAVLAAFLVIGCAVPVIAQQPLAQQAVARPRPVDLAMRRAKLKQTVLDDGQTIRKITDGKDAPPGKFPFQVALIWSGATTNEEYFSQFCGGTLIAPNWVLTAAHCVPNTPSELIDVYLGTQELPKAAPAPAGAQRFHVALVLPHHAYKHDDTFKDDIALIKLATSANLSPATVATPEIAKTVGLPGNKLTVVGWGATENAQGSSLLREVDLTVQQAQLCQENYEKAFPGTLITANMFCAGEVAGGKGVCSGDSGGFIGGQLTNNVWAGMGIVSFGSRRCAKPGLFGVFTRVANYMDWITKTIKAN